MKKLLIISIIFFFIETLVGQEIKWDAEFRVRSEMDNRDFHNSTPPNYFTLSRIRLGAFVLPIENIKLYVQLQDSRVFGEEKNTNGKFNTINYTRNIDLHQGFLQIDNFLISSLTVKIGRQRLSYGSERLIGPVLWGNIGRVFDGGLVSYEIPEYKFDLFVMNTGETNIVPTAATPEDVKFVRDEGQLFSGFYYSTNYLKNTQIDIYALHQLDRSMGIIGYLELSRYTFGTFMKGSYNDFFYEGDLAFQLGKSNDKKISSNLFALSLGYRLEDFPISSLMISYERLSGTPAGDDKIKTFDPPYATGHKFYGYMDYFVNIPVNTYNRGLQDVYFRAISQPVDFLTISLTMHNFNLVEKLNGKDALGQELDLVVNWKYNKYLNFEGGYSAFIPDEIFHEKFGGYSIAQWAYLTTQFNF